MEMVTSKDGSLVALLSASQSIGVPQPLKLFGNDDQKKKYFPRLAKGAISAFALTEVDAGSDPANMHAHAEPTPDGTHFVLNGEKLWCTNGTRAELFVVMARTPDAMVNGKPRKQITAFIIESNAPGVEVVHRCRFMGLKAIENGVIRFTNVRVPSENILWGEGKGLKLALITLNTGRLTLPASCAGGGKAMLQVARTWANQRVEWGQPIGKHEAVAQKIALMAANTFAMESVAALAFALAKHLRWAERHTRHLGRMLFHAMARFGPKLERRQMVLFRGVDIGADLFAMTAACVRARMLAQEGNREATELADLFCREARQRIKVNFARFYGKNDGAIYRVS